MWDWLVRPVIILGSHCTSHILINHTSGNYACKECCIFNTVLFDMHKTTFHLNPSYIPEQAKRLSRNSEQGCHNPPQYFKQRLTFAVSNMNLIRQRTEGKGSQDLTSVKTSFWSVESSLQHQTVYIQRAVCVTLECCFIQRSSEQANGSPVLSQDRLSHYSHGLGLHLPNRVSELQLLVQSYCSLWVESWDC